MSGVSYNFVHLSVAVKFWAICQLPVKWLLKDLKWLKPLLVNPF